MFDVNESFCITVRSASLLKNPSAHMLGPAEGLTVVFSSFLKVK